MDLRKRPVTAQLFPLCNFADRVANFLAIPFVRERIVDAGVYHTCTINTDGEPVMFGHNGFRQCEMRPNLGRVSAVAAGGYYTCAIKDDGELVCSSEECMYDHNPPPDLGPVKGLACGEKHTCTINAHGELRCFGRRFDDAGQSTVPQSLGSVSAVSAGKYHTCAIKTTGELVCFGDNLLRQCSVPFDLGAVLMVAAGDEHTCAIQMNGSLVCFGCNEEGQCDVPRDLGPIKAVAAGKRHTCAVKVNGRLACFGSNSHGQCSPPPWLDNIVSVAAGAYHTCAVRADGTLVCFGISDGSVHDEGQCKVPVGLRVLVNLQPLPLQLPGTSSVHPSLELALTEDQNGPFRIVTSSRTSPQTTAKQDGRWCSNPELDAVVEADTVGLRHPVSQDVQHTEIAADISPEEAALIAAQQQTTWIEHNVNASGELIPLGTTSEHPEAKAFEKVFLLRFTRNPWEFERRLHEGRELEPVRTALQDAGFQCRLPSGAAIFVHPDEYSLTKRLVAETSLRPYHVLVAEPFLCLVEEAVSSLRHGRRGNVRLRSMSILAYCACRRARQHDVFVVEKTFFG